MLVEDDVFNGFGVEVILEGPGKQGEHDGLKIKELQIRETLTRIGIPEGSNILWQSCHILHIGNRFAILHFKELFGLDGKPSNFTEADKARRNTITNLLKEWGLLKVKNEALIQEPRAPMSVIKVISFKDKGGWELRSKYTIGKRRKKPSDGEEVWDNTRRRDDW